MYYFYLLLVWKEIVWKLSYSAFFFNYFKIKEKLLFKCKYLVKNFFSLLVLI